AATLREFNIDAFVMEMGVTNPGNQTEQTIAGEPLAPGIDPVPEPEVTAQQFDATDAFVRFLAPPPRGPFSLGAARGALLFRAIELHDGEARGARNRFLRLTEFEKRALQKFLQTL